ncbi:hypothetical protein KIW84_060077 [Lathyrus oleraceus]|uniref:Uncharacterized protein n=1 Tax=Pisum sativum TaxID=3888 RepID=A0A9D5A0G3_PEA|nr:hypothetical protein KIW84_060077 [Pisum sativum]
MPTVDLLPPLIVAHADPVSHPESETVADAELDTFGGVPFDLSLLPLYPDHTAKHIWNGEERDPQKFVNHGRKIVSLPQPDED